LGVDFSGDGKLLLAIGMHETSPVSIFDWSHGTVLSQLALGHTDIYQIGFNPFLYNNQVVDNPDVVDGKSCYTIISCGSRSVRFWSLRRVCELVGVAQKKVTKTGGGGGGFKGRQLAVPKNKQKWEWKYTIDGNVGVIPKKQAGSVEITCFCAISEKKVEGRHILPQSKILTGASNGCIYIWQQQEVSPENADDDGFLYWLPRGSLLCVVSDIHDGPVFDVHFFSSQEKSLDSMHRIVTCSRDGSVNVWELDSSNPSGQNSPMQHLAVVSLASDSSSLGQPRSVTYNLDGSVVVVGTTHNCVCTLSGGDVTVVKKVPSSDENIIHVSTIINGNYGKARRVAAHPFHDIFATVAGDKSLRLWSAKANCQVGFTRVNGGGSAVAFTPDGRAIAVGTESGEVIILSCDFLQNCSEDKDEPAASQKLTWEVLGRKHVGQSKGGNAAKSDISKTEITDLKYSASGDVLAVATRDKIIHLLSTASGYKQAATCRGHSGAVSSMDFSADGMLLQSSDGSRETLYWEVSTGKMVSDLARVQQVVWYTWTNLLGPSMQGICNGSNGNHPQNHVEASGHNLSLLVQTVCRSNDSKSIVAGGGGQLFHQHSLKLFKYPCVASAVCKEYYAHTSGVSDVCFLISDYHVVSVGGNDCSILVWAHR